MYLSKFIGLVSINSYNYVPRNRHTALHRLLTTQSEPQLKKPSTTCFIVNSFCGQIVGHHLFPYPDNLSTEQKQDLQVLITPVEKFFREANDPVRNDNAEDIDPNITRGLWELGVFGLQIPIDLGGVGLSHTQYIRILQIFGENDLGVGVTLAAHQSLGCKGILLYGSKAQKKKYLPRVACGDFASFCLTEPEAGSDIKSMRATARLNGDKTHYILNGTKSFITNGGTSEVMTVFAKTEKMDKSGSYDQFLTLLANTKFQTIFRYSTDKKITFARLQSQEHKRKS